jgi:hypothetical protein
MTQRKRSRSARKKWRRLVSEQWGSGQTVTAFCRERGLWRTYFFVWKKRLRKDVVAKFLEVHDELYLENLQLQKELLQYKKASYGQRADRLSENELAQALLEFAEELEQRPLPAESIPQGEAKLEV